MKNSVGMILFLSTVYFFAIDRKLKFGVQTRLWVLEKFCICATLRFGVFSLQDFSTCKFVKILVSMILFLPTFLFIVLTELLLMHQLVFKIRCNILSIKNIRLLFLKQVFSYCHILPKSEIQQTQFETRLFA